MAKYTIIRHVINYQLKSNMNLNIRLVAIAKDESAYLSEWIHHHLYFGVDSIEIYVNNTTDNTKDFKEHLSDDDRVRFINANEDFKQTHSHPQTLVYQKSFEKAKSENVTHVLFLDIDEFWIPKDFKKSIHDAAESLFPFDVLCFEWFVKYNESEFSTAIENTVEGVLNPHLKSLVSTSAKVKSINIHSIEQSGGGQNKFLLADGSIPEFMDSQKSILKHKSNILKNSFVMHRMFRSEMEYVSLLGRGRPLDNGLLFKDNRFGYHANHKGNVVYQPPSSDFDRYQNSYSAWIERYQLDNLIVLARKFVHERFEGVLETVKFADEANQELIAQLFLDINLSEVKEALQFNLQFLNSNNKARQHVEKERMESLKEKSVINSIRDSALFLYNEKKDLVNAIALMQIAANMRPEGPAIKKYLSQWKEEIDVS